MSRIENDFLGSLEIPDDVYYGVQTMRGKQNFHITEMPMSQEPFFAIAFAYVKKAAALTNKELGTIPADLPMRSCGPATSSSPASTTISSSLTGSRVVPARPRT